VGHGWDGSGDVRGGKQEALHLRLALAVYAEMLGAVPDGVTHAHREAVAAADVRRNVANDFVAICRS
jgi:hypothetical protein